MQDVITNFTTVMTWLVLFLCFAAVLLLGLAAWQLPPHARRRAFIGVMAMVLIVLSAGSSLYLLPQIDHLWSGLLLPLAVGMLVASLYRLSFPPSLPVPAVSHIDWHLLLLLILTVGTLFTLSGLVIFDVLSP